VARFGGDEFVVLVGELMAERTDAETQAKRIAEKIRSSLAQAYSLTFARENDADTTVEHQCTASIGVALFIHHEASQDDILKWADKAMYQAKAAGRNQIRFYDVRDDGGYLPLRS
jgi:diguanylate cyclase (GGDEF)-like protein